MSSNYAEAVLAWTWRFPLHHYDLDADDWYEALAFLLAERSPA